jgi:hypothetical protein
VCSSHQFQKALIAAIVYTLVYINLNPMWMV